MRRSRLSSGKVFRVNAALNSLIEIKIGNGEDRHFVHYLSQAQGRVRWRHGVSTCSGQDGG